MGNNNLNTLSLLRARTCVCLTQLRAMAVLEEKRTEEKEREQNLTAVKKKSQNEHERISAEANRNLYPSHPTLTIQPVTQHHPLQTPWALLRFAPSEERDLPTRAARVDCCQG